MEKIEKVIQMEDPFTIKEIKMLRKKMKQCLGSDKDTDSFLGACLESAYMVSFVQGVKKAVETMNGSKALGNRVLEITINPYEVKDE